MDESRHNGTLANGTVSDEALGRLFAGNAPRVAEDEIWERIQPRIERRPSLRSTCARGRTTRRVGFALAALVLVAVLAVGIYVAATRLGGDEFIVVIDDDPMSPPTVTAAGPTTTAAATETTAAPAITTAAGAFYPAERFQLDLGPADQLKLAEAWERIAARAGLDARSARAYEYTLDYSADGEFLGLSFSVTLGDARVLAVQCDVAEGTEGGTVLATARPTDAPTYGPAVADDRLYEVFAAIDRVGPKEMLARLPRPGSGGYYQLGRWEPGASLPVDQKGYLWMQSSFDPFTSSRGLIRPDEAQWVWIPAVAVTLEDGGGTTPTTSYSSSVPVHFFVPIARAASTGAGLTDSQFASLLEAWAAHGIVPLAIGHRDKSREDAIFVSVAESVLTPPDGFFTSHRLVRQAFLTTHQEKLPFNMMSIFSVSDDGAETMHHAISLQSGMHFQEEWAEAPDIGAAPAGEKTGQALRDIGGGTATVSSLLDTRYDGRVLEVSATLASEPTVDDYTGFLERLTVAVQQLNQEGCKIALMQLSVDDVGLTPVLRDVHDYQLGSVSSWYAKADYQPPWISRAP